MQNRNSNVTIKQSKRADGGVHKIKCKFIRQRMLDMPSLDERLQRPVLEHLAHCSECREYYSRNYYTFLDLSDFNEKQYSLDDTTLLRICRRSEAVIINWKRIFFTATLLSLVLFSLLYIDLSSVYHTMIPQNIDHISELTDSVNMQQARYSEISATFFRTLKTMIMLMFVSIAALYTIFVSYTSIEKKGGYSTCFSLC